MEELSLKTVQRYRGRSLEWLKKEAQKAFNAFIRERDKDLPCISCGSWNTHDAGHYYAAGQYSGLRFNEYNVNFQCVYCNRHLHSNAIQYRKGLVRRYGEEIVKELDVLSGVRFLKRNNYTYMQIIEKYRKKLKEIK